MTSNCDLNPANDSALLASLFPGCVRASELRQQGDPALLYDDEARQIVGCAQRRVLDFTGGRLCARRSLLELGVEARSLQIGRDRQPCWPAGITGSITHTDGFCGAVLALRQQVHALGVDAEIVGSVSEDLWPEILVRSERVALQVLPDDQAQRVAALMFSAKEAYFKCQYSITGEWLDFHAVEIGFATQGVGPQAFSIRRLDTPTSTLHFGLPKVGRYHFEDEVVFTGICMPASLNRESFVAAS